MYAKLDSEVLASVISTVILYLMTIILKIQSANSSRLRIDVLFHLLSALDWSPGPLYVASDAILSINGEVCESGLTGFYASQYVIYVGN